MIALYPANKLEHLSVLLQALMSAQPSRVFEPECILVESPGMQHWVNMEIAQGQGIAMNLQFPLPVRFIWDSARQILTDDLVPKKSPYRREVLVWTIDDLLQSGPVQDNDKMAALTQYWAGNEDVDVALRRFQLATAIADVFEQYLLYRADWLSAWEQGLSTPGLDGEALNRESSDAIWQAELWRLVVEKLPYHPAQLLTMAIEKLQSVDVSQVLPKRVIVFGINTMAPQMIAFLDAIAQVVDVHIFHLNPSVSFWGDTKSDKERIRLFRQEQLANWMNERQDNPLLANLGQQGRDMFNMLTELDTFEISGFETDMPEFAPEASTLLQAIQQDILHAQKPSAYTGELDTDNSIKLVKCHSPLREVQVLHDQLLAMMQADPSLKPKDIVVMCPAIEDYASFVESVFRRGGYTNDDDILALPCSIADRSPLDAEPLVAVFLELLRLPDSRFEHSKIVDYLRLPALQAKFNLAPDDLDEISYWLTQANVRWGLDGQHKSRVSEGAANTDKFSWKWGLKRLLRGMIYQDHGALLDNLVTVPDVEGQNSVLLGRLMRLVERLEAHTRELLTPRSAEQWAEYLFALCDDLFVQQDPDTDALTAVTQAIGDLKANCDEAEYQGLLKLSQVREVLTKQFSTPDLGNHFMTGQVTFCSMMPMRSIPFKVVAILGLNDGDFPRRSQPISIDLMAAMGRRRGDRSRRGEDRYLFLEAIISARHTLYLSYQANSATNNAERQPSLVLQELIDVLQTGYCVDVNQLSYQGPLHPFSLANYQAPHAAHSAGWFRLASMLNDGVEQTHAQAIRLDDVAAPTQLTPSYIGKCLANPLAFFANQQLNIQLDEWPIEDTDVEPFSTNKLTQFTMLDSLYQQDGQAQQEQVVALSLESGALPDLPTTPILLESWQDASDELRAKVAVGEGNKTTQRLSIDEKELSFEYYARETDNAMFHVGTQSDHRKLAQWVTALALRASDNEGILICYYIKWDKGEAQIRENRFDSIASLSSQQALQQLRIIVKAVEECVSEPMILNASIGESLVKKWQALITQSAHTDEALAEAALAELAVHPTLKMEWRQILQGQQNPFADNPYVSLFFPLAPELHQLPLAQMQSLYLPYIQASKDKKC